MSAPMPVCILCRRSEAAQVIRSYVRKRAVVVEADEMAFAANLLRSWDPSIPFIFVIEDGDPAPPDLPRSTVLRPPDGRFNDEDACTSDLAAAAYGRAIEAALGEVAKK